MATIARTLTAKLRPNKDSDIEEIILNEGDDVKLVQKWEHFYLIKDNEGHFINLPHDAVNP